MTNQLTLQRNKGNVLASADEHGVSIFIGWTVGIPAADAINYVKAIDADPNKGFFAHNGKVVLSHGSAKLTLSQQEANAIVDLIKSTYGVV
ncbi:hypothetical protein [Xanthomonas sacchari]|uniref:hypothetical protein n=1 Tax=Xanthomonas sacchari TaxID=56458 RepID=UPI002258431D|nr:hypothetical protein [Xanthomonas sacchari]MCW0448048.1 hypothetical protein [Xanthomonas sacchari]